MQVARNQLTSLRGLDTVAASLGSLDISENPLTSLDGLPAQMPVLSELSMQHCKELQELGSFDQTQFPELRCLDMTGVSLAPECNRGKALRSLSTLTNLTDLHMDALMSNAASDLAGCTTAPDGSGVRQWLPAGTRINGEPNSVPAGPGQGSLKPEDVSPGADASKAAERSSPVAEGQQRRKPKMALQERTAMRKEAMISKLDALLADAGLAPDEDVANMAAPHSAERYEQAHAAQNTHVSLLGTGSRGAASVGHRCANIQTPTTPKPGDRGVMVACLHVHYVHVAL